MLLTRQPIPYLNFTEKFPSYKIASNMKIVQVLCVHFFKWLPVLFIVAIIAYSYYTYVVLLCLHFVENIIELVSYLFIYHLILAMFLWSYWQTIFTQIGVVPKEFKPAPAEVEKLESEQSKDNQRRMLEFIARDLPVVCRTKDGFIRYCEKCHHIKPDRAHHCSSCGVCVLKMDHHCPWFNNCVSYTNYKFFILFLGYVVLYCLFIMATSLRYCIKIWTENIRDSVRYQIFILFFGPALFAASLIFLFSYHCYLISLNRSTLEYLSKPHFQTGPDKNGFNLGRHANFVEVFGEDVRKWFLPIFSSLGNGISFPTHINTGNLYNPMRNVYQNRLEDKVLSANESPV